MAGAQPIGEPAPADGLLPPSAQEGVLSRSFHAYVHVPFCKVRCGYCDFNTYTATELQGFHQSDFVKNLQAEIGLSSRVLEQSGIPKRPLKSVFFGGGTPTQLPASELVESLALLESTFGIDPAAEVTTEANPDNVTLEYLQELFEGGFNRISLGMQSADPEVLQTLDRTHTPANVPLAVTYAKQVGLQVSVDLIYGAPGETFEQWQTTVDAALSYETDHISAYALIVEDGTKLARAINSGHLEAPDEDLEADKYEYLEQRLSLAGFEWYELSNWSRSAQTQSTHNLAYWQGQDWWGYGPGAHSHVGGVRWWNAKHPTAYASRLASGDSPAIGRESLNLENRLIERVMLESRLRSGIPISLLKPLNPETSRVVSELIAEGLIEGSAALSGQLILSLRGRLLADSVLRRLLP